MHWTLLSFSLIMWPMLLLLILPVISAAPLRRNQLQLRAQLNPDYMRAITAYRRLEQHLPRQELRALTTIGILNGARQAGEQMEQFLVDGLKDLVDNVKEIDANDHSLIIMPKINKIEKQLKRDRQAIMILTNAMDLATRAQNVSEFKRKMQQALSAVQQGKDTPYEDIAQTYNTDQAADQLEFSETQKDEHVDDADQELGKRIAALRRNIMKHMKSMKWLMNEKIENTLDHLIDAAPKDGLLAQASQKTVYKRHVEHPANSIDLISVGSDQSPMIVAEMPAQIRIIESILSEAASKSRAIARQDDFQRNLIEERMATERLQSKADNATPDEFVLEFNPKAEPKYKRNNLPPSTTRPTKATKTNGGGGGKKSGNKSNSTEFARQEVTIVVAEKEGEDDFEFDAGEATPSDNDGGDGGGGGGGGGGLVGIISSLSGGEGGSDVGALIGALTGVVSTLFGPGGLDIETLISTSTSLISGLLSGNQNFGTVLGQYVGTAFDGLSGGGGAINNGQFIGNFLGTVFASLSADPEEDDAPPQPLTFAQNLLSSFIEAKNRRPTEEVSEERKGSGENKKKEGGAAAGGGGGSDSGSFVKHIASHLVSNLVSLILNASLGASGGAFKASSSLFSGSSAASHHTQSLAGHYVGK